MCEEIVLSQMFWLRVEHGWNAQFAGYANAKNDWIYRQ
jgi:hypothetical protein